MNWERFRCNVDCNQDPDNCIRCIIAINTSIINKLYIQTVEKHDTGKEADFRPIAI